MSTKDSTSKPAARKLPDGMVWRHNAYYAQFSSRGRRIRKKLSTDFRVACEMLAELRLDHYRGTAGVVSNDYPLDKLLAEWLRSAKQTIADNTTRRYTKHVDHLLRLLAVRNVSALDAEHVEVYRAERLGEGVSAGTVNLEVAALGTALGWAARRKRIGRNPLPKIKPLRHDRVETRPLALDEVKKLLDAEPSPIWRNIWFAYLTTGLRRMELAQLVFSDVDWRSRELIVRATQAKGNQLRRIPIDDRLMVIIEALHTDRERRRSGGRGSATAHPQATRLFSADHIFVTEEDARLTSRIYRRFMKACRLAGIETKTLDADGNAVEAVTPHSLRHTFCTHLLMAGQSPRTVQDLMGHKTLEMTMKVYAKVFPENKRAAIGSLPYGGGVKETPGIIRMGS